MQTKKGFLAVVFTLLPFGYAVYLYPSLGSQIPIHFNIDGKADGWASRNSIFIMPIIMGFVSLFTFLLLTNIESLIQRPVLQKVRTRSMRWQYLSAACCVP